MAALEGAERGPCKQVAQRGGASFQISPGNRMFWCTLRVFAHSATLLAWALKRDPVAQEPPDIPGTVKTSKREDSHYLWARRAPQPAQHAWLSVRILATHQTGAGACASGKLMMMVVAAEGIRLGQTYAPATIPQSSRAGTVPAKYVIRSMIPADFLGDCRGMRSQNLPFSSLRGYKSVWRFES